MTTQESQAHPCAKLAVNIVVSTQVTTAPGCIWNHDPDREFCVHNANLPPQAYVLVCVQGPTTTTTI